MRQREVSVSTPSTPQTHKHITNLPGKLRYLMYADYQSLTVS